MIAGVNRERCSRFWVWLKVLPLLDGRDDLGPVGQEQESMADEKGDEGEVE